MEAYQHTGEISVRGITPAYFSPLEAIRFILFLAGQVKNKWNTIAAGEIFFWYLIAAGEIFI